MDWESLDENLAVFIKANIIPAYKERGTAGRFRNLANNTAVCYRHLEPIMFIFNERLNAGETLSFFSNKIYTGCYLEFTIRQHTIEQGEFTLPYDYDFFSVWRPRVALLNNETEVYSFSTNALVKSLLNGGFQIRSTFESDRYLIGTIHEMRLLD